MASASDSGVTISCAHDVNGLQIHALSNKSTVEELEMLPSFKGELSKGIKIGPKFSSIIEIFGMSTFMDSNIIKYPRMRMYLFFRKDTLICAKLFDKNSEFINYKLIS